MLCIAVAKILDVDNLNKGLSSLVVSDCTIHHDAEGLAEQNNTHMMGRKQRKENPGAYHPFPSFLSGLPFRMGLLTYLEVLLQICTEAFLSLQGLSEAWEFDKENQPSHMVI